MRQAEANKRTRDVSTRPMGIQKISRATLGEPLSPWGEAVHRSMLGTRAAAQAKSATSYTFPGGPVSNLALLAKMTGHLSGNSSSSSLVGNTNLLCTARNGKAASINGAGSGAQLTARKAQIPFNWVCKLQKRDATLSQCGVGERYFALLETLYLLSVIR
jgi:hypothetical protein